MPSHSLSLLLSSMGNIRFNFRGCSWSLCWSDSHWDWECDGQLLYDSVQALKINVPPDIIVPEPKYDAIAC